MKNRIKMLVASMLVVVMLIPCLSASAVSVNNKLSAQANINATLANNIVSIENQLRAMNTDVTTQLKKQITDYQNLLNSTVDEPKRNQINMLIAGTNQLLSSYTNYKNNQTRMNSSSERNENLNVITPNGVYNPIYSPAVAAVSSWFSSQGYKLAAELLTYSTINNSTSTWYQPTYGYEVRSSGVYYNIVVSAPYGIGSASFPKGTATLDNDLYYAIHAFEFTKSTSGLVIRDVYDYAYSDMGGLEGIAVNTMYTAQQAGVIVPYHVLIT